MKRIPLKTKYALPFAISGILAFAPVYADKPSSPGGGKNQHSEQKQKPDVRKNKQRDDRQGSQRDNDRLAVKKGEYFEDRHRTLTREYYSEQFRRGHCPPGLAKKNNGCQPPGQAKKWAVGRPLPREVIFHAVPPALVTQYGRVPSGYRYVRVASDILLIAIGTGMVIDAIQDLGGM